jgi:hypothetical protein
MDRGQYCEVTRAVEPPSNVGGAVMAERSTKQLALELNARSPLPAAPSHARGQGGLGPAVNELTPRHYLAPASQCGNSSRSRRLGSHHGASNDDAGDDSTRLA